ncbi:MAG TPA: BrnA antitoxin family protein [Luteimonas sp.]|nr:BrnA antitoxin family protein [Luteimonas sp.]HRO26091.1 BrnA antitoxin family protein [Luteimonas sp.]HRP71055.1 BrnA antitoxin family protein [Luteimonas sp.]
MSKNYDFINAKRVDQVPALARAQTGNAGKERITIRLDPDVLAWFRAQVKGGGNYQTLINDALRTHIEDREGALERTLRRVIREELHKAA